MNTLVDAPITLRLKYKPEEVSLLAENGIVAQDLGWNYIMLNIRELNHSGGRYYMFVNETVTTTHTAVNCTAEEFIFARNMLRLTPHLPVETYLLHIRLIAEGRKRLKKDPKWKFSSMSEKGLKVTKSTP